MSIDNSKNFLGWLLDKIFKGKRVIVGDKAREITNKINKLRALAKDAKLDKNIELEHEERLRKNERIYSNFSKAIYSHLKNLYQKVLEKTQSEEDTKKIFGCTQEKWNERFIDEADDDFIELLALWEESVAKIEKNLDETEKSSHMAELKKWHDENKDTRDLYEKFNNSMVEMERWLRREISAKACKSIRKGALEKFKDNMHKIVNWVKEYERGVFEKIDIWLKEAFSPDAAERKQREELEKLRDKILSSDSYIYLKNFVKKYLTYNATPPQDEIYKLQLLLARNGFSMSHAELTRQINLETDWQEYSGFEIKLLQNKKSDDLRGYIESFVGLYGYDLGYRLKWLEYFLRKHHIAFEETELIKEMASIKEELELSNFKEKLVADNAQFISMHDVDLMNGFEFEHFLKNLFEKMGYLVNATKLSGDQGGDLVISKLGEKIVVQAKRSSSKVNNKAIQEVVAAINYYNANKGIVITNNEFTKSAIELAEKNNVDLVDRNKLQQLIEKYL